MQDESQLVSAQSVHQHIGGKSRGLPRRGISVAHKASKKPSGKVEQAMREFKRGKLKGG
jgi:hypothetical protein